MRIRLKSKGFLGNVRSDSFVRIDDVLIKEDLIAPEQAKIELYFKGDNSSGIITLKREELDKLLRSTANQEILAKKMKVLKNRK